MKFSDAFEEQKSDGCLCEMKADEFYTAQTTSFSIGDFMEESPECPSIFLLRRRIRCQGKSALRRSRKATTTATDRITAVASPITTRGMGLTPRDVIKVTSKALLTSLTAEKKICNASVRRWVCGLRMIRARKRPASRVNSNAI